MHLLGNHEDSLLRFLDDVAAGPQWLFYGGEATVASYGINPAAPSSAGADTIRRVQTELRRRLPPRPLEFLKGLKLMRSEERGVGKERVRTCKSRWWRVH